MSAPRVKLPAPRVKPPDPRVKPPERRGNDPISASVLGHQPEALLAFMKLYGRLWSHGILPQSTKEMARIRNARTLDCGI